MTPSTRVLVTGANGNVGRHVIKELVARGHTVLATRLGLRSRAAARQRGEQSGSGRGRIEFEFLEADLTDAGSAAALVDRAQPDVIVHLAAVIPPYTYRDPAAAHHVNVHGTEHLVRAAESLRTPPHVVHASSMAVYGARNPHRHTDLIDLSTPTVPTEFYGAQKLASEDVIRSSTLPWTILRLGGVLTPDLSLSADASLVAMEAALPIDGRIHTVAVEDVAVAFERAVAMRPIGEIFLIGGDETHRRYQHQVGHGIAAAMGLRNVLPPGRRGDPDDDRNWFITDWLDTSRSELILNYQRRSFDEVLSGVHRSMGWRRPVLRLGSPIARRQIAKFNPYLNSAGRYADPWAVIAERWGWPLLEPGSTSAFERGR
jgi:nucleoside-diphosphate-sugar epimerase